MKSSTEISIISDAELANLFKSSIKNLDFNSAEFLYCKKYNLNMDMIDQYIFCNNTITISELINRLLSLTDKQVDGDLISIAIQCLSDHLLEDKKLEKVIPGLYTQCDEMLLNLLGKLHLFESSRMIIDHVIEYLHPDFNKALLITMCAQEIKVTEYLLNEKKFNINLKSNDNDHGITPIQYILCSGATKNAIFFLRNIIECLINHDPDCVKVKDSDGNNIFWYLKERKKNISPADMATFNEIEMMIRKAYYRSLFMFFSGKLDDASVIKTLPEELVNKFTSDISCSLQ